MIHVSSASKPAFDRPTDALNYQRVARALRFLDAHRTERPTLQQVADHVGLSPHHLQRTFQRFAGVSPKQFLQYLTRQHALSLLAEAPALHVACELGLGSTSRLHDLMVSSAGATPGEVRRGGERVDVRWGIHRSPFGACFVALTDRGVCHMAFVAGDDDRDDALRKVVRLFPKARLAEDQAATAATVEAAFEGAADAVEVPMWLRGTPFQLNVWQALLSIPPGCVRSYAQVAEALGSPQSSRAVGNAVGANPLAYLIPCHRIILGTGATGGYRWGPERKRAMLGREAARRHHRISP